MEKCFLFHVFISKLFSFFRYLHFYIDFKLCRKTADKKVNVNFKIYGLRDWATNNCNKHIAQYLKKKRQSGNEIWLVNKI